MTTSWIACTFCAPDGTVMSGKCLCPICDGARGYDPTPPPPDSPVMRAMRVIETWRREWADYDASRGRR